MVFLQKIIKFVNGVFCFVLFSLTQNWMRLICTILLVISFSFPSLTTDILSSDPNASHRLKYLHLIQLSSHSSPFMSCLIFPSYLSAPLLPLFVWGYSLFTPSLLTYIDLSTASLLPAISHIQRLFKVIFLFCISSSLHLQSHPGFANVISIFFFSLSCI